MAHNGNEFQQTTCDHNAPSQKLKAGVMIPCLKCGTLLEPAINTGGTGGATLNASYPGNTATSHKTATFTR